MFEVSACSSCVAARIVCGINCVHLSVLPDAPHAGPGVLPHHQELRRTRHLRRGAVSQGVSSCIMHMPAGASCTTPMLNGRDHSNAQCKLVTNACMSHGRAPTGCRARVHRWGTRICGVKTGRPALRCTRISSALAPRGTTPTTRPSFAHMGRGCWGFDAYYLGLTTCSRCRS